MTKNKCEILKFKVGLHNNKEIGNIYNIYKNDDEILKKSDKLFEINKDGELHFTLLVFRDDVDIYKKRKRRY